MHDVISKVLYSLPETIEALVRAVASGQAGEMDFTGLVRLASQYPATDQRTRYGDMLWECPLRAVGDGGEGDGDESQDGERSDDGGEGDEADESRHGEDTRPKVLIVVEFQSRVDPAMPLRLLQYIGSAWLEWARIRELKAGTAVPLVMPVLVYGGRSRWTAPTKLEELMPAAGARWLATQPHYEYLLLEERRGGTADLPEDNLVTELVAVARARSRRAMVRSVSRLRDRIGGDAGGALDRAVSDWLRSVVAVAGR